MVGVNLWIYADDSGSFTPSQNRYFVIGGLLFLGTEQRDKALEAYTAAEEDYNERTRRPSTAEIKASHVGSKTDRFFYEAMGEFVRFAAAVDVAELPPQIAEHGTFKQGFSDYALLRAVENAVDGLVAEGRLNRADVTRVFVRMDQSTMGLRGVEASRRACEGLFRRGGFNDGWTEYREPIFPGVEDVSYELCDSEDTPLIRAADFTANILRHVLQGDRTPDLTDGVYLTYFPES